MELKPRYGPTPIVTLDGPPDAVLAPALRQYRRLVGTLSTLTDEQWHQPSRCAGWSAKDVVAHLESATSFFSLAIASGVKGEPTRFLVSFDPVASPPQLIAGTRDQAPAEVFQRFADTIDRFLGRLERLDHSGWTAAAEAPPGHIAVSAVVHHALWDSWVHERDILLPLGTQPAEEPDEVAACLRYAAALAPAFALSRQPHLTGTLRVEATDPEICFVVEVDGCASVCDGLGSGDHDVVLTGTAVELLEGLSVRRPLDRSAPPGAEWLVNGLVETFDGGAPTAVD